MSNLSFVRHVGDGSTTQFALAVAGENIGYFRTSDIHGYVDDVEVAITINTASPHLVIINPAPKKGADVLLRREMPLDKPYANFERGNNFGHRQVNNTFEQQLYLTQEMLDGFTPEGFYLKQNLNVGNNRIENVEEPVNLGDAVNKKVTNDLSDRLSAVESSVTGGSRYIHWLYSGGTAAGGEVTITVPYNFTSINAVHLNGIRLTYGLAYDYNSQARTVEFAEALEEGDEVVVSLGTEPVDVPELDVSNNTATALDSSVSKTISGWLKQLTEFGKNTIKSIGSTISRSLEDRFSEVANVRDFGAVGDGVTDDTAAIQKAIDQGGRVVGNPKDTYKTSYTLFIGNDTEIDGRNCKFYFDTAETDACWLVPKEFQSTNATVWTENISLKNFKLNTKRDFGNGIGLARAKGITVSNVDSDYIFWHLIDAAGAHNGVYENLNVRECRKSAYQIDCLTATGGLYALDKDGNMLSAAVGLETYDWVVPTNNRFINCVASNVTLQGFHFHRSGGKRNTLLNCTVYDSIRGVLFDANVKWYETAIIGCTFHNVDKAIWANDTDFHDLSVFGCTFVGKTGTKTGTYGDLTRGIYITTGDWGKGRGVLIASNTFKEHATSVYVQNKYQISISGNTFYEGSGHDAPSSSPSTAAVYVVGDGQVSVANNVFTKCIECSIYVAKGARSFVRGAVCNNVSNDSGSILVHNMDNGTISGNQVNAPTASTGLHIYDANNTAIYGNSVATYASGSQPIYIGDSSWSLCVGNMVASNGSCRYGIYVNGSTGIDIGLVKCRGVYSASQIHYKNSSGIVASPFEATVTKEGTGTVKVQDNTFTTL